ncbi:anthranilate synthase component II [Chryseomicrobium aureum]|uniref:anthranilate synthase component II n=1 Tax=Chryseomicrobium aureum TaxID=1441723 RepID=UPI00370D9ADD
MILLIDHYDSFTYNLAQYFQELGEQVEVVRYDTLTVESIQKMNPTAIVLSPGPGHPKDYTVTQNIYKELHTTYPFLGICLGHQLMGLCTGAAIISAPQIFHGKTSRLLDADTQEESGVVMRYHSLAVDATTLPEEFLPVSFAQEDGTLMEMRHRTLPIVGMQYHPESIGTPDGRKRLANYLQGVMRSESYL